MSGNDQESRSGISVTQGVSLALALIIGGGVWRAAEKVSDIKDDMEVKFVSKEVFQSEMASIRREAEIRHEEIVHRLDKLETALEGHAK